MTKKERLKLLITGKTPQVSEGLKAFDSGIAELKKNLEETIRVSTLDEVSSKINDFRKKMDFTPIISSIDSIRNAVDDKISNLTDQLDSKLSELDTRIKDQQTSGEYSINQSEENINQTISNEINRLRVRIASLDTVKVEELKNVEKQIKLL